MMAGTPTKKIIQKKMGRNTQFTVNILKNIQSH